MVLAFCSAWRALEFVGFSDPDAARVREQLARAILEQAARGERNAAVLCNHALCRIPPQSAFYVQHDEIKLYTEQR
jgi:hypothetical protein